MANNRDLSKLADILTDGTSGQVLTANGVGNDPTWQNAAAAGVTSVTGTAPIVSSGGTTPAISITAATTSAAGSMSAADKTKLDGIAAGATANTGTVTSVGGTGSVNGITLSGTVTTSGDLTLGGALSGVSLTTQVTGTLPVANGGTGATDAATARTNLGLGTGDSPTFAGLTVDTNTLFVDATNDRVGIGTSSPGVKLHTTVTDAATATVTAAQRLEHLTTGTSAQLFGVSSEYYLENAAGASTYAGAVATRWTSATAGAESSKIEFYTRNNGAMNVAAFISREGYEFDTLVVNGIDTYSGAAQGLYLLGTINTTSAIPHATFVSDISTTNTVVRPVEIGRRTTGTPAVGIGAGMQFKVETASGVERVGAAIDTVVTNVTNGSFDMTFSTMLAGATAAERLRIHSSGGVSIGSTTDPGNGGLSVRPTTLTNATSFLLANTGGNFALQIDNSTGSGSGYGAYSRALISTGAYPVVFDINGGERMRISSAGDLGLGGVSSPAARLHVQNTTAATNTVTPVLRIDSQSSGTPATGIGVGMQFAVETAANNTEIGATIEAVTTDVTAASEDFDLVVKTMAAGATAAERVRVSSGGTIIAGETAAGNSEATALTLDGYTTATPAAGFGTGLLFRSEVTDGLVASASIRSIATDMTLNSEDFDLVFSTFAAGISLGERFRFASTGALGVAGANYGTAGQVLTSGGPSAAPSWAAVSAPAPTTAQVLSATAGAAVAAVGTYALLKEENATVREPGATVAGSSLQWTDCFGANSNIFVTGTWMAMFRKQNTGSSTGRVGPWLRIS